MVVARASIADESWERGIVLVDSNGDVDLERVLGNDAGQANQIYTGDRSQ